MMCWHFFTRHVSGLHSFNHSGSWVWDCDLEDRLWSHRLCFVVAFHSIQLFASPPGCVSRNYVATLDWVISTRVVATTVSELFLSCFITRSKPLMVILKYHYGVGLRALSSSYTHMRHHLSWPPVRQFLMLWIMGTCEVSIIRGLLCHFYVIFRSAVKQIDILAIIHECRSDMARRMSISTGLLR